MYPRYFMCLFSPGIRGVQRDPRPWSHRPGARGKWRHCGWGTELQSMSQKLEINTHKTFCYPVKRHQVEYKAQCLIALLVDSSFSLQSQWNVQIWAPNSKQKKKNIHGVQEQGLFLLMRNLCAPARLNFCLCVVLLVHACVYLGAAQDPGAGDHWAWRTCAESSWRGESRHDRVDLSVKKVYCGEWCWISRCSQLCVS